MTQTQLQDFSLQAVLFDMDGTLLDTAPDLAFVLNELRQNHDLEPLPYETIRNTVSNGARALVSLGFQLQEQDAAFTELHRELLALYSQHLAVKTTLFPGLPELLDWMDDTDLPWGVVTNKPRAYAEPIMVNLNLAERCSVLVCPDDVTHRKPHPEPLLLACQQIACEASQSIYLGDHRRDIEAGFNAGMKTLAVNYGYIEPGDSTDNWQADFYVDHANEIQAVLSSLK